MNQILKKVEDVDRNNSEAVKDVISSFFQIAPKHVDHDGFRWLKALENVINRYPKYCISHRATVENVLVRLLDSDNYHYVLQGAKCAHILQQVRPSHEKTATPKTGWRDQMSNLCDALHKLIGAVFPHAIDIYQRSEKTDEATALDSPFSKTLSHITVVKSKSSKNKHSILANRLKNIFVFIQVMLVEVYPYAKSMRPQIILDVIVRSLSVTSANNLSETQDQIDVAMVKTQTLRTLDALVACLGPNLIPFSPLVFRFVMQTLKWSSENRSEESRKVRIASYASLIRWLRSLKCENINSRARRWADDLAGHLIEDITPATHVVQLQASAQPTKHLSKKAKRKLANTMLQESSIASHMPGEKKKAIAFTDDDDELAIAALECVETFFTVCGIFLPPTTHKLFQENLVRECFNLSSHSCNRSLHLLRALDACRKAASPSVPPPTQYCLRLYSEMINSEYQQISTFCAQALLDIRLHLHCSPPSLNFSIEVPQEKAKRTEEKKVISERNRAVLDSLLNSKSSDNRVEEVITITDEPSRKRPKLDDDVTDKISVSSESASIEISDDSEQDEGKEKEVEVILERRQIKDTSEDLDTENETQLDEVDGNEVHEVSIENVDECDKNEIDIAPTTQEPLVQEPRVEEHTTLTQFNTTEIEIKESEPSKTIFEAATQMPVNSTVPMEDEDTPNSIEIAYDYPNTGKEKIAPLEKIEDENLPSTNDTDDIQITCGQVVKNSQDVVEKNIEEAGSKISDVPKVNGVKELPTKMVENCVADEGNNDWAKKISEEVSVEDMLADFVDEVNEDTQVSTPA